MSEALQSKPAAPAAGAPDTAAGAVAPAPAPVAAPGKAGMPVLPPAMAFLELAVLLVLPATLDYVVKDFPSLTEMQPHYFWLPVLLLSLQYGTVSGLVTAGVAIAFQALLGWPEQEIGENHFNYLLRIWAQPMLWVMAALVLGQFRSRQIERKLEAVRQVEELDAQRSALAAYANNLRARCDLLERRLATGTGASARDLLAALGRTRSADTPETAAHVDASLALAMPGARVSLWTRDGDGLKLVHAHGWTPAADADRTLAADHPLTMSVLRDGRALSVLTPGEEAALERSGLAAVPVLSPARGDVVGMLRLEHCPPSDLDGATVMRLAALAHCLAPLIDAPALRTGAPRPEVAVNADPRPRVWRRLRRRAERSAGAVPRSASG